MTRTEYAAEITALRSRNRVLREALEMGVQLCESGGHGRGKKCPTCHFVRVAKQALR